MRRALTLAAAALLATSATGFEMPHGPVLVRVPGRANATPSIAADGPRVALAWGARDRWQLEGCPDDGPAMSVDATGVAHVVWPSLVDRPEPHKAIFYSWTLDGRSFAPRVRITQAGRHAAHPQVAAHRAGATVVWDEVVDGARRVVARRHSRSQRTFAPVALSDAGVAASYPVAAVVDDDIVAAWVQGGGNDSVIAVRRFPIQ